MPILAFMPKLYANSILVMLNNRMTIRDSRNGTPNTNIVSTFVIADHQIGPSDSAISHDEVPFSTSATSSPLWSLHKNCCTIVVEVWHVSKDFW